MKHTHLVVLKLVQAMVLTKWACMVSAAGWPATADGWAVVGGQEQGGVRGWPAPSQFSADRLGRLESWPP